MLNDELIQHEITPLTIAILPLEDETGNFTKSIIYEETGEYVAHILPTKIIDSACKYFGSSLKGRLEGTRDISGITHKAPIVIDPASGMYFYPTASPVNKSCSWIAHSHIDSIHSRENNQSEIVFKNGKTILFDVSYGSMMNQVNRTAQFRFSLEDRMSVVRERTIYSQHFTQNNHSPY